MSTTPTAVIFDFNGVLIFDRHWHEEAWLATIVQLTGEHWENSRVRDLIHGRTNQDVFAAVLGREPDPAESDRLGEIKESKYRQMCVDAGDRFSLSPGAYDLLDALAARGIPVTIATASGERNMRFFYEMLELDRWFNWSTIAYDDGTIKGKPEPDIYLRAAALLGISPSGAVVFEDSLAGMRAARRAGISRIVAVGDGGYERGAVAALSDLMVTDLSEYPLP